MMNLYADAISAYGLNLVPIQYTNNSLGDRSDNKSFWNKGYASILAIEDYYGDFTPYYHTPNDTLSTLDMAYYTDFVKASLATFVHLTGCMIIEPTPTPTRHADTDQHADGHAHTDQHADGHARADQTRRRTRPRQPTRRRTRPRQPTRRRTRPRRPARRRTRPRQPSTPTDTPTPTRHADGHAHTDRHADRHANRHAHDRPSRRPTRQPTRPHRPARRLTRRSPARSSTWARAPRAQPGAFPLRMRTC